MDFIKKSKGHIQETIDVYYKLLKQLTGCDEREFKDEGLNHKFTRQSEISIHDLYKEPYSTLRKYIHRHITNAVPEGLTFRLYEHWASIPKKSFTDGVDMVVLSAARSSIPYSRVFVPFNAEAFSTDWDGKFPIKFYINSYTGALLRENIGMDFLDINAEKIRGIDVYKHGIKNVRTATVEVAFSQDDDIIGRYEKEMIRLHELLEVLTGVKKGKIVYHKGGPASPGSVYFDDLVRKKN